MEPAMNHDLVVSSLIQVRPALFALPDPNLVFMDSVRLHYIFNVFMGHTININNSTNEIRCGTQ